MIFHTKYREILFGKGNIQILSIILFSVDMKRRKGEENIDLNP